MEISKAGKSEDDFAVKCNDLTVIVSVYTVRFASGIFSKGDFILRHRRDKSRPPAGFDLGRCIYYDYYDREKRDSFHLVIQHGGENTVEGDTHYLRVTGYRAYISWNDVDWYEVIGLDDNSAGGEQ
jgi:hypothetical protein